MNHYDAIDELLRLVRENERTREEALERFGGDRDKLFEAGILGTDEILASADQAPFEFLMRMPRASVILIEALMYLGRDGKLEKDLTLKETLQDMQSEQHHGAASQICSKKHLEMYLRDGIRLAGGRNELLLQEVTLADEPAPIPD